MKTKSDLIVEKRIFRPIFCISEQLTQNIRLIINDRTVARFAMLERIRRYFSLFQTHLIAIDHFAETYQSKHAINWYTKDSFLHRVINKVLREGNLEFYTSLRFFISDLSEQLYQLKCDQQRNGIQTKENTILYRGLRQSVAQLEALRSFVGQVILTKSFMSTSTDKHIALFYAAPSHPQSPQSQSLLIEISVDMTAPDIIAADISRFSEFPDEKEVLFDIGMKFRVDSLAYDSLRPIWCCRLVAMPNESPITTLSQSISSNNSYADLNFYSEEEAKLERMTSRERRRKFFPAPYDQNEDSLWRNSPSVSWIAISTVERARIAQQRALINWHKSLDVMQFHSECKKAWKLMESDDSHDFSGSQDTASFLNNLGFTCQRLKMTDTAIKLLRKSSEIRERIGSPAHFRAQSLRNLGLAHVDKGNYEDALIALEQALVIGQQSVTTSQWSTSMTLSNFVYFYHAKGDYRQAIEYYFRALETLKQCVNLNNKCCGK